MKLLNDFFRIDEVVSGDCPTFSLTLNGEHEIFKAHFPGSPIVPGVCQVQMLLEAMGEWEHGKLSLRRIKNVKYLSVMTPMDTPQVQLVIQRLTPSALSDEGLSIIASFQYGGQVYTKLSLTVSRQ